MIYILMGVSGSGKTTVGQILARKREIPFYDGDDFHPEENINKMRKGEPLTDEDRILWLQDLRNKMNEWHAEGDAILGCSALKESYRKILMSSDIPVQWILLNGDESLIAKRLTKRSDHFFDPALLNSQYQALEIPVEAWQYHITDLPEDIAEYINDRIIQEMNMTDLGIIGMGVMGQNLALNFCDHGYSLSVYNRHLPGTEEDIAVRFANTNPTYTNIRPFDTLVPFIQSLTSPRNILIMVKAGSPVDTMIVQLKPFLEEGDCIIDGGNSHFSDTERRMKDLSKSGIQYIGMGISGGEEGARNGPSMMPGGSRETYGRIRPMLESIAAKDDLGRPCCMFIGPGGSGHFVKMMHNGIEYAEMQLLADCVHILHHRGELSYQKIAYIFEEWRDSDLDSYLLQITIDILKMKEGNDHILDLIRDVASHKGTGSLSVIAGLDLSIPTDSIFSALAARQYSSNYELRKKASDVYNSAHVQIEINDALIEYLANAYKSARLINHIIGFQVIRAASKEHKWDLDLAQISRIWTNGCIIRSKLMTEFIEIFQVANKDHLLLEPMIISILKPGINDLTNIVSKALTSGIAVPTLAACLNYFLAFTTKSSSANLISAQRDFFGAHGFQRVDDDDDTLSHANW